MKTMLCRLTTVRELPESQRNQIVVRLTKLSSEFSAEVAAGGSDTPVSVVEVHEGFVIAWAATHIWNGMQTLEGFTGAAFRRKGLARLAAAMLFAAGKISKSAPLAVFSEECVKLASSLGSTDIRLYRRSGNDWQLVPSVSVSAAGFGS